MNLAPPQTPGWLAALNVVLLLVSKQVTMMLNVHRKRGLLGTGRKGGGGGTEVGGEGDYIPIFYTVTTRMTSALRWAAMRAIFNVSLIVRDKVTRQCPQTTTFEEKGEPKQIRTEVPLLTSLPPYR